MKADCNATLEIEKMVSDLRDQVEQVKEAAGFTDQSMSALLEQCTLIQERVRSNTIRVAVVGAIKSGKSTFINGLLGQDLLKRGAGVVTSIITQVKKAERNLARVQMKTWDEINQEIEKAIQLYPDLPLGEKEPGFFDLRRKRDREYLHRIRGNICSSCSVADSGIRPESILIANACDGYDRVGRFVEADPATLLLEGDDFAEHKRFTGDQASAFFVRGVILEIESDWLLPGVEIADCQGSDATDVNHLSQILEYLVSANLILYLVASRTGLREADIRFLKQIRTMGLLENLMFVVNVDLSEHEGLSDLKRVEKSIQDQLLYLTLNNTLYSFSSLLHLFEAGRHNLPSKEAARLDSWLQDKEMADASRQMLETFQKRLRSILLSERDQLLVSNSLEQFSRMVERFRSRVELAVDVLSRDRSRTGEKDRQLQETAERTGKMEVIMKHSLKGAMEGISKEVERDCRAFFDPAQGILMTPIRSFFQGFAFEYSRYESEMALSGLKKAVFLMFQDFQSALDTVLVETVFPEVVAFVRGQEKSIASYFRSLYHSCSIDLSAPETAGTKTKAVAEEAGQDLVDVHFIRGILGLSIPRMTVSPRYSARIKLESATRFGIGVLMNLLEKAKGTRQKHPGSAVLAKTGERIRKEALQAVSTCLVHYGNQIREEYLMVLVKAVSRDFTDKLSDRFQLYNSEVSTLREMLVLDEAKQQARLSELIRCRQSLTELDSRVGKLALELQR